MASIGLRKPYIATLNSNGTYTGTATLGKAVSTNITPNYAEGSLYGDDIKCEEDREFTDASIEMGVTTVPTAFNNVMFGHTVSDGLTTYNANDESNYVGYGTIGVEKVDGVKKYVAMFLPKCKFYDPGESLSTKGDSITYNTPTISGTAFALDSGVWKYTKACDTESAAISWIETKFGGGILGTYSEFSTSATYAVGDYVVYTGDLYRCVEAVTTAGAWNASKWLKVANAVNG